jgi:hypothetical protein
MAIKDLQKLLSGELDNTEEDEIASPATKRTDLQDLLLGEVDPATDTIPNLGMTDFTKEPTGSEKPKASLDRMAGAAKAGTIDVARSTVVGATSTLELMSMWEDMNARMEQEKKVPFSTMQATDQVHFRDFLNEKGVTDPEIKYLTEDAKYKYRKQFIEERKEDWQEGMQKTRDYVIEKWQSDPEYLQSSGWIEDFVKMGPQIGAQILATLATGGVGGAAVMFAQISGNKTESLMKQGVDFKTAATAGIWDAALQTPLEQIGISKLTKFMKTRNNLVAKMKEAVRLYGTEVLTEYAQAYPDAATEIWGKNPDASKMEMVGEFLDRINDPEFHKQGLKEGMIAGAWSMVAGGAAQVVKARADITDESGTKNIEIESGAPGVEVVIQDERNFTDVKDDAENVPSVETLLGVETDPSTPPPSTPEGVSVSNELTVTDEQRTDQHQNTDAIKQVLGELAGERAMAKHNLEIDVAQSKLDSFVGFYNDMVEDGDAEGGLQIAQMMETETNNIIGSYEQLRKAATARAKNRNNLPSPEQMEAIDNEIASLKEKSDARVQAQTKLVHQRQAEARQAYIESLETVEGLQTELIGATNQATRENQPKMAKLYNNVISEMRFREASGHVDYFSKTPMKKLIDLEVQATLIAHENKATPNVDANVIERDNAIHNWIKKQQQDRIEYDQVQLVGDRAIMQDKVDKAIAAEKVEKTQAAEAKPVVKTRERRRKNEQAQRQRKEQARISATAKKSQAIAAERQKAKGVVRDQAKVLDKPKAGETRAKELEEAKADKAKRVAQLERQQRENADLDAPKEVKPKIKRDSWFKVLKNEVKEVLRLDKDPTKRVKKLKDLKKPESTWTILTSDNPNSTTASKADNDKARQRLKDILDGLGMSYRIGKSKFGKDSEIPFIIPNLSKDGARKISQAMGQTSYIYAEGKDVHYMEGGKTISTVSKSSIRKNTNPNQDYTQLEGERFTIPFFEESDINMDDMNIPKRARANAKAVFKSAAIKLKNGKVYTGHSHLNVIMENPAVQKELSKKGKVFAQDGFTMHNGEFVKRSTATQMLGLKKELQSEDIFTVLEDMGDNGFTLDLSGFNEDSITSMADISDRLKGKYKWLHTIAKAMGLKMEIVFNAHALRNNESFRSLPAQTQADIANDFDKKLGRAFGGIQFINASNLMKFPASKADETLAHEVIHGIVRKKLKSMGQKALADLEADLQMLWNSIPDSVKTAGALITDENGALSIKQGIKQIDKNIHELITYSMTNPSFAQWLNQMKTVNEFGKKETIWSRLVEMITKIVNPSKLTDVMTIMNTRLQLTKGDVRFKAADLSFDFGSNVTTENVAEWAKDLDNQAKNNLPTIVAKDVAHMSEIVGFDVQHGNAGEVVGIWTGDGALVINAEAIQSQEDFVKQWMHEQVAHHGLREVFGDSPALFNRFLDQSWTLLAVSEADLVEQIAKLQFMGKVNPTTGKRTFKKTEKRELAEEVIARRAEQLKPITRRGILSRFKAFVKRWLPKRFVDKKDTFIMKDEDIWNVLLAARENVFTGSNQFGQLLTSALNKRAARHKFQGWKNLPDFMESDETYLKWAKEVLDVAPDLQDWYRQHEEIIDREFGKDSDLFKVLLAVTSPQADVETNVQFAIDTYQYLMGLRDKPGALYANKLKKRIDENWTSPEAMLADLESKNFKVTEFTRALLGDQDATVGDLWMFRAFYGDPAVYDKQAENYSIPQITGLRQKLHSLAAQMSQETGKPWSPREMQAAIWVYVNAKQSGKKIGQIASYKSGLLRPNEKYGGKTPVEFLKTLVPNLSEGPLSDRIGLVDVPLSPLSPLTKKLLDKAKEKVRGKHPISKDGAIKVLTPGMTNDDVVKMANAIVAGGRTVVAPTQDFADWYQKIFGFEVTDGLNMELSDAAIGLYTDARGKVTFKMVRDNLGGFSGNYTQAVRFSVQAQEDLGSMAAEDSNENDQEFLRTEEDKYSHVNKIHEWRDQSTLNVNRMTNALEQEFLEKFGGRKSNLARRAGVGSGRLMHTAESELASQAFHLFLDTYDITGPKNEQKVEAYRKKLMRKPSRTVAEIEQLKIIDRMQNMTAGEVAWARDNIRPHYDNFFDFAQSKGILDTHIDAYVKRTWIMPKEYETAGVSWNGTGTTGFKLTPSSGKQRSFDSIVDGWEAGMELRTKSAIGNLNEYANEIGYVYANRRFTDYMKSLVNETGNGIIIELDSGVKPPENFTILKDRGFARPGKVAYARKDVGDILNKLSAKATHSFWNIPAIKWVGKMNATIKSTLLSVSMFHHLAGIRSYVFGVSGTGWQRFRPIKAYREGLKKIDEQTGFENPNYQHLGPIVDLLVKEGLTFGRTQDWEGDTHMAQSSIESMLMDMKAGKASGRALHAWQGMRRWKRQWTNGLFNQLFAGLKAQSGAVELTHKMRQMEKKLGRGLTDAEIKTEAAKVARLINADFGGLHLGRMGRNPDFQKLLQYTLLAPDWTESNWRTVTGIIPGLNKKIGKMMNDNPPPPGMEKVYRKFWAGIAMRSAILTVAGQWAVLALFGDEDDREEYFKQIKGGFTSREEFAKGRWTGVDITPVIEAFGGEMPAGKRANLSLVGHFKDILKATAPITLAKHKTSPITRLAESMATRTDWKNDRFKTLGEMWRDKNPFDLVADPNLDPKEAKGWLGAGSQLFAAGLYNVFGATPIPLHEVAKGAFGPESIVPAVGRAVGVDVREVRHKDPAEALYWEKSQEVKRLERALNEAKLTRDNRMITEARMDIKRYDNFNQTKSRLGFARARLSPINKKIRALEKLRQERSLTVEEIAKLRMLKRKQADIYQKFADVIGR